MMSGLTFDQLNAYVLYKNKVLITKKKKNVLIPNIWPVVYDKHSFEMTCIAV